jgi:acyl-homoserine lactone acylase PvdQ
MSRRALIRLSIGAFAAVLFLGYLAIPRGLDFDPKPYVERAKGYDVEIVRDTYGVPHV